MAVALVTGSARGIGLAVARRLAGRGDVVHVVWRSSAEVVPLLEEEFGGRVHRADLESEGEGRRLVEEVLARDGRLDVVVHAVGAFAAGPLEGVDRRGLRRMLSSNVESALELVGAARPALRSAGGEGGASVVLFGCAGLAGLRPRREAAAYAAAKSALVVLARSLALEEAPYGVRVNVVSPGLVPHDGAHPSTSEPERAARVPLGRVGTPEDVAEAVAWLTSPEAAHVTGVDLPVAGGWML